MLLDQINEVSESKQNVLYFCKFERENATVGTEMLLSSDSEVINGNNPGQFFEEIAPHMVKGKTLPILVPFDFVTHIYPDLKTKRSGLPLLQSFIPDDVCRSNITRKEDAGEKIVGDSFTDPALAGKISAARERIRSGELLQVVLSRKFEFSGQNLQDLVRTFALKDGSLYVFYYQCDGIRIAGSSPENLVTRKKNSLEIYPIAGTVRRSTDPREDLHFSESLVSSEKDTLEHRMLVDLARNDLGKVSVPGSVVVEESMKLRKYASVQHLVSKVISAKREDVSDLDILRAVFPAGTVSGAPKKRALQIINEYEDRPRGAYSGAIGTIAIDGMDLALLIRSVFSYRDRKEVQAGAGIVKDSNPEFEVQEMYDKSLTVTGGMLHEHFTD